MLLFVRGCEHVQNAPRSKLVRNANDGESTAGGTRTWAKHGFFGHQLQDAGVYESVHADIVDPNLIFRRQYGKHTGRESQSEKNFPREREKKRCYHLPRVAARRSLDFRVWSTRRHTTCADPPLHRRSLQLRDWGTPGARPEWLVHRHFPYCHLCVGRVRCGCRTSRVATARAGRIPVQDRGALFSPAMWLRITCAIKNIG